MKNYHKNSVPVNGHPDRYERTIGSANSVNLRFDAVANSYLLDIDFKSKQYLHLDPYDSAAQNGNDSLSTFDEANVYDAAEEFQNGISLENNLDKLGMHMTGISSFTLSAADRLLEHTPEDDRDDLDEEG